jgi:hypothetical protein
MASERIEFCSELTQLITPEYLITFNSRESFKPITNTVESRLSDRRLSDIPFYPTCRVGTLHFVNSHSEGLNSIETALACVEQQREATATDVLLFRRWRDLGAKKRKEVQKQIPISNFKKKENKLFHLHYVKYDFCL